MKTVVRSIRIRCLHCATGNCLSLALRSEDPHMVAEPAIEQSMHYAGANTVQHQKYRLGLWQG